MLMRLAYKDGLTYVVEDLEDKRETTAAQANSTAAAIIAKLAGRGSASVFLSCLATSLVGRGNGRIDTPPRASCDHQQRTSRQGKTHPPNGTSSGAPMREQSPRTPLHTKFVDLAFYVVR